MPSAASTMNQVTITGPNTLPTFAVPKRWPANRPNRITHR
jgi:hypothetical protein